MKLQWITLLIGTVLSTGTNSQFNHNLCKGIVPPNDLWIDMHVKFAGGGITEEEFHSTLDRVEGVYRPLTHYRTGDELIVKRSWELGTVNAFARIQPGERVIHLFGGLARHPLMTADAFAMVVCHELGHHLGGTPRYTDLNLSVEGQADYYSSLECFKRIFKDEDNIAWLRQQKLDLVVSQNCEVYLEEQKQALCIRSSYAGETLAKVLHAISSIPQPEPSLEYLDINKVFTTAEGHPLSQCRLDTYKAGAICNKDSHTDDEMESFSVCREFPQARPACWFANKDG